MLWLALASAALALLPLVLALLNLRTYRPPGHAARPGTAVSVLIPARDEAKNIGDSVRAALVSRGVEIEVVVLDDHSRDGTADIVEEMARRDARVRLERAPPLPPGWSGKQHACHVLSQRARHDLLLFVDADVRLSWDAVALAAGFVQSRDVALASGFPRQVTVSLAEHLMIPIIHVLLLGYLPMDLMRRSLSAGLGAGCGQFLIVRRADYERAGGHAAIRSSLHDGLKLPRAFRRAGFKTDVFDATPLATCRMYEGGRALWEGFSKNATEGMATPQALPVWTVLLLGGHVLPWVLLPIALVLASPSMTIAAAGVGVAANLALRALLSHRYQQDRLSILLHPVGMLMTVALQWSALIGSRAGRPASWRGRHYPCG